MKGGLSGGNISLDSAVQGLQLLKTHMIDLHREAEVDEMPVMNFILSNSSYLIASQSGSHSITIRTRTAVSMKRRFSPRKR